MKKITFLFTCVITVLISIIYLDVNSVDASSNEKDALTQSKKSPGIPFTSQDSDDTGDATGYWTKERMQNAIPLDKIKGSDEEQKTILKEESKDSLTEKPNNLSDPVAPEDNGIKLPKAIVPATTGKLFFTDGEENYVCSASAVNNDNKNLVMTAAHCIHGGEEGDWYFDIVFAPAYYNGSTPYGVWNWKESRTFSSWIENSDYSHDQAFFTVYPKNGFNLVNVVGGNGLSTGYGPNQPNVRVIGWPSEFPYDGETPYHCEGPSTRDGMFSSDAKVNCEMNRGSSGGPWFREMVTENVGYIFAVTSRQTISGPPYLLATPNSAGVATMFDQMD